MSYKATIIMFHLPEFSWKLNHPLKKELLVFENIANNIMCLKISFHKGRNNFL